MTGGFSGHPNCPLYGYCVAVKTGVSGWYCNRYVTGGETSFTRFFAG